MCHQKAAELAVAVRDFTEAKREKYYWPANLEGACASASYLLARLLQRHKFRARFAVGVLKPKGRFEAHVLDATHSEHAWVELEGPAIIDVTATQFGRKYPRVLVTDPEGVYWDHYITLATGPQAVRTVLDEWGWSSPDLSCLKRDWYWKRDLQKAIQLDLIP
jgi:hypothetical protein